MKKSYENTLTALAVLAALPLAIANAYAADAAVPATPAATAGAPAMTADEMKQANQIYF